jgi:hypothetical protein
VPATGLDQPELGANGVRFGYCFVSSSRAAIRVWLLQDGKAGHQNQALAQLKALQQRLPSGLIQNVFAEFVIMG